MNQINNIGRTTAMLTLFVVVAVALVAAVNSLTKARIQSQIQQALLSQLAEVIPAGSFDNDLIASQSFICDATLGQEPLAVYRARKNGDAVALAMTVFAPDSYSGTPIQLLVGILKDGSVSAVRVISHKETPGLGDAINLARSNWILGFAGQSLTNRQAADWAVKKDGGTFDQFTGATITPRAVVGAVYRALQYYAAHSEALFNLPNMRQAIDCPRK